MSKKNFILGGILLVLLALAYLYKGPIADWRAKTNKPHNFLSGLDIDKADKIEIKSADKDINLEKKGERWHIAGTKDFYVPEGIMSQLIKDIKDAAASDLEKVSANADKKDDFNTSQEKGTEVKIFQGEDQLADFIVGKAGSDFKSTYISEPGANETFLAQSALFGAVNRDDWYDKTIFSGDKDKISSIRFQYPVREFTIEKKDDTWSGTLPYKFKVNKEKIEPILGIMSNLTAVSVPEQNFAGTGLEKNLIIIEAKGDGIDNILMVGEADSDGNYFAKRGDSDNIYLISKEQRDKLDKRIRDLR